MTSAAYETLFKTAARRIEQEWTCNDSESAILTLIAALSYGMGQSWACIPCLGDMAAATGFHKATISRSVRSAVKKRYLITAKFGEEMLYKVCTGTKGEGAPPDAQARALARAKLEEIQRTRLRGQADADGQMRMPGMFASEELDAPAAAFEAMMEDVEDRQAPSQPVEASAAVETVPRGTEDVVRPVEVDDGERLPDAEFVARLRGHMTEYEARAGDAVVDPPAHSVTQATVTSADTDNLNVAFARMTKGLSGDPLYALQMMRVEVATRGKFQEAQFIKSAYHWRKMATKHPRFLLEAVGDHKTRRLATGWRADAPAGYIHSVLKEMLGNNVPSG